MNPHHQGALERLREMCHNKGLALTHQRQIIYETMLAGHGHPSPEEIYEKVRRRIPAISLGTVYNNIKTFVESGILREVSPHHGSLRVEINEHPHHHLVCVTCKSITDIPEADVGPVHLRRGIPKGFKVQRYMVDIIGQCDSCRAAGKKF